MNSDDAKALPPSSPAGAPWVWSIGIYAGRSPLQLAHAPGARNPVLSAASVTDVPARFVADPFMLPVNGLWHMFFEVLNDRSDRGEIGLATSPDGLAWSYRQIVLSEPFHLSYPYVFRWNQDIYMLPETLGGAAVRLYRAVSFPTRWEHLADLVPGAHADPSIFFFHGRCWLFTCPTPYQHDTLALYTADILTSTWTEHPSSPLIAGNASIARPGGRVITHNGQLLRFTQQCSPIYGKQVRAFAITELTPTTYRERELPESPVLTPVGGDQWNASGMHHVDAHPVSDGSWLACVDGLKDF